MLHNVPSSPSRLGWAQGGEVATPTPLPNTTASLPAIEATAVAGPISAAGVTPGEGRGQGRNLDQVGSYMLGWMLLPCLLLLLTATAAEAQSDLAAERGRAFAQIACARCHAIGPAGDSPIAEAPPFRVLHHRYPVEDIQESLAEGMKTGHPMPEFQLDSDEIRDLLAYLKSLER